MLNKQTELKGYERKSVCLLFYLFYQGHLTNTACWIIKFILVNTGYIVSLLSSCSYLKLQPILQLLLRSNTTTFSAWMISEPEKALTLLMDWHYILSFTFDVLDDVKIFCYHGAAGNWQQNIPKWTQRWGQNHQRLSWKQLWSSVKLQVIWVNKSAAAWQQPPFPHEQIICSTKASLRHGDKQTEIS